MTLIKTIIELYQFEGWLKKKIINEVVELAKAIIKALKDPKR